MAARASTLEREPVRPQIGAFVLRSDGEAGTWHNVAESDADSIHLAGQKPVREAVLRPYDLPFCAFGGLSGVRFASFPVRADSIRSLRNCAEPAGT